MRTRHEAESGFHNINTTHLWMQRELGLRLERCRWISVKRTQISTASVHDALMV